MAGDRKKIKELEVMVAETIVETADTTTLVLFTGNDHLEYAAGHFLTIDPHQFEALERFTAFLEDLKGRKEPPRAYSLASAPHERYLAITVKEERYTTGSTKYPPLLSPLLVKRTTRGMRFVITGFTGPYTLPQDIEQNTDHVVHLCAGSGIVPNFSILKFALNAHPKLRHTLIYANKTRGDVIFGKELDALAHQFPKQLRVVHALTRETDPSLAGPDIRHGRVTVPLLRDCIADPSACVVYLCGPANSVHDRAEAKAQGKELQPRFFESSLAGLLEIGVPKDRIEHETYG
jgi:3-ketosteroid 9alpha-monooxygenase subunit B